MPSGVTLYRAPNLPSANLGGVTGAQTVLDSRGNPLSLPFPTNGSLDGVPFQVIVGGYFAPAPAASRTVTVTIFCGAVPVTTSFAATSSHAFLNTHLNMRWDLSCIVNGANTIMSGFNLGVMGQNGISLGNNTDITIDPNQDNNTRSSSPLSFTLTWNATSSAAGELAFINAFELRV